MVIWGVISAVHGENTAPLVKYGRPLRISVTDYILPVFCDLLSNLQNYSVYSTLKQTKTSLVS